MTPNQAYKITDKYTIGRINNIKLKEYEKINKKWNYLEKNELCLLNPKVLKIGKNTLIPNKVKKGKINKKIPVKILNRSGYGYYNIKAFLDYQDKTINIREGKEYIVDCVLLKKIQKNTWDAIVSQKNRKWLIV